MCVCVCMYVFVCKSFLPGSFSPTRDFDLLKLIIAHLDSKPRSLGLDYVEMMMMIIFKSRFAYFILLNIDTGLNLNVEFPLEL